MQAIMIKTEEIYKVFQGRTLHVQLQVNKEIQKPQSYFFLKNMNAFQNQKMLSL
jgi:hypothetical protein